MKRMQLAAVATALVLGFGQAFAATEGLLMLDKQGMVTKAEAMKVFEKKYDEMSKARGGKMTPEEFQNFLSEIQKTKLHNFNP
jgi:hypothetical protein